MPLRRRLLHTLPALSLLALGAGLAPLTTVAAQPRRPLQPEDWYRFQAVSDLTIAHDGAAVAYLVTRYDEATDESVSDLWMADWAGNQSMQLTRGESVSEPRFSPDGRYLSFLSARPAGSATRVWLLDRRGGEPRPLGQCSGEITGYQWSPDARQIVLVVRAGQDPDKSGKKSPLPLVLDAFQFKADKEGYLTAESRSHLYLLDVADGACAALTVDPERSDSQPAFSPDGAQIAYVSNAVGEPYVPGVDDIELVEAAVGARPRKLLSTWSPNHQKLGWSPDGRQLAFLQGDELKYNAYILDHLAVADATSGKVRPLAASLDRAVVSPQFSADGRFIQFAVEDDGYQYPAQVSLASGAIERLGGSMVVNEIATAAGHTAVLAASDRAPVEVYALEGGQLRGLSAHNEPLFASLTLGAVEDISFRARDGTEIHGQLVKPPGFVPGQRYPTILWIHGGPDGQDDHAFALEGYSPQLERQLFATHGYAVLAVNYRGSSGRGAAFARSIVADWGDKEVEDLLAGVDYAIASGVADSTRLGVGGWSYGGLLTDYLIASTTRFKAAIAGAGSGNQLSMYGSDEYVVQYNAEIGPPWRNTALWLKVSYPFFHADRIHTPTLFLGGDKDFNVPLAGGEQMYQALRTLGVPAELIVYPGEYHRLTRPSFLIDRWRRYLGWMTRYLATQPPPAQRPQTSASVSHTVR
jgi:dipeptidyl aminopeptidase/acylaminoacyl peptidase